MSAAIGAGAGVILGWLVVHKYALALDTHRTALQGQLVVLNAKIAAAAKDKSGDFYQNKLALAEYFVERILPELDARIAKVKAGSDLIMNFSEDYFTNQA